MVRGVTMGAGPLALFHGAAYPKDLVLRPANDNGAGRETMTVTVRRKLDKSGVTVRIKVPVAEYVGVAVGSRISEEGALTSTIELVHPNEDFNYRVFSEEGNVNVVAEWQNWGKKLRLPLYIRAGDGSLVAYSQQVDGVMVGNRTGRRMLAADAERRTRFARRRKPGEIPA
ncbi:DUF6101 family protein [Pelagibacterium sediminicola]|uniref:DUF6101 family protein n=1 Tax=Pelagibacterium sediminicola TaxID=2248761 RepID=UPI000E30F5AC|nr:DUF6101 family protein [Pelagibacterium sediminicola]